MSPRPHQRVTLAPGGVRCIEDRIGCTRVSYLINGPRAGVEAYIETLMQEFHPSGYGTCVKSRTTNTEDRQEVIVQRAASCD